MRGGGGRHKEKPPGRCATARTRHRRPRQDRHRRAAPPPPQEFTGGRKDKQRPCPPARQRVEQARPSQGERCGRWRTARHLKIAPRRQISAVRLDSSRPSPPNPTRPAPPNPARHLTARLFVPRSERRVRHKAPSAGTWPNSSRPNSSQHLASLWTKWKPPPPLETHACKTALGLPPILKRPEPGRGAGAPEHQENTFAAALAGLELSPAFAP